MAIEVDVPALTALGHRAEGFTDKVRSADKKVDGTSAGMPHALVSSGKLGTLESVWTAHLVDLRDDLHIIGGNLIATARTCRGHDAAGDDLFQPISWADQHHNGVRP